jgi:tetratricopeptide (TPR) repeat protein
MRALARHFERHSWKSVRPLWNMEQRKPLRFIVGRLATAITAAALAASLLLGPGDAHCMMGEGGAGGAGAYVFDDEDDEGGGCEEAEGKLGAEGGGGGEGGTGGVTRGTVKHACTTMAGVEWNDEPGHSVRQGFGTMVKTRQGGRLLQGSREVRFQGLKPGDRIFLGQHEEPLDPRTMGKSRAVGVVLSETEVILTEPFPPTVIEALPGPFFHMRPMKQGLTPGMTNTALFNRAAVEGNMRVASTVLDRVGGGAARLAMINGIAANGCTPLFCAVSTGHKSFVTWILAEGAGVDLRSAGNGGRGGLTPMQAAVLIGEPWGLDMASTLLDHGAAPHGCMIRLLSGSTYAEKTVVEWVPKLLAAGASVDEQYDSGATALLIACEFKYRKVVRLLLDHGANVDLATLDGRTPLGHASFLGHTRIVKLLCEHGADTSHTTPEGTTPLDFACINNQSGAARALQYRGASAGRRGIAGAAQDGNRHGNSLGTQVERRHATKSCIACGVHLEGRGKRCAGCHVKTKQGNGRELGPAYCGRECQVAHWKQVHRRVCPVRTNIRAALIAEVVEQQTSAELHRSRSLQLVNNDNDYAMENLVVSIALDPREACSFSQLGQLFALHKGDFKTALILCTYAVGLTPDDWFSQITAYRALGDVLQNKGDIPGAIEAFRQAVEVQGFDIAGMDAAEVDVCRGLGYFMLGNCLGEHAASVSEIDDAITYLEQAVALSPTDGEYWLELAKAHHNRTGLVLNSPQPPEAVISVQVLDRIFLGLERMVECCQKSCSLCPSNDEYFMRLGVAAIEMAQWIHRLYPGTANDKCQRALGIAFGAFQKAIEINPSQRTFARQIFSSCESSMPGGLDRLRALVAE